MLQDSLTSTSQQQANCNCILHIVSSGLSVVVAVSFFIYLLSFFLLERFELDFAGTVTVGIFSVTWACLIIATTFELLGMQRKIRQFQENNNDSRLKFSERLRNYCRLNIVFGLVLCTLQVLAYNINIWFKDEIVATCINGVSDISCLGVAYG